MSINKEDYEKFKTETTTNLKTIYNSLQKLYKDVQNNNTHIQNLNLSTLSTRNKVDDLDTNLNKIKFILSKMSLNGLELDDELKESVSFKLDQCIEMLLKKNLSPKDK